MARGSRLRRTRWPATLILVALLLLYAANVPFYSGSTLGRALAHRKRREIDGLMARARQMRRVLDRLLRCRCPTLEDCGNLRRRRPPLRRRAR